MFIPAPTVLVNGMKNLFSIFVKALLTCLFILGCDGVASACRMMQVPERPRSMVNPGLYILVGEVIGYTHPIIDAANFRDEVLGIKLRIIESIQFPYHNSDDLELFSFHHDTDCFPVSAPETPLVGTRLRMVLAPATLVASKSGSNGVRLQSNASSRLDIDRELFGYSTKADLEFDYKNDLAQLVEKVRRSKDAEDRQWLDNFLYIEASKDLIRLARARTDAERMNILERLLYCPNINYRRLIYSEVGKPFKSEEHIQLLEVIPPGRVKRPSGGKKLSKREKELMAERARVEESGALRW